MAEARLIKARDVRARLGVTGGQLARLRKRGLIPGPVPGTRLYDFDAIKRALDALSGMEATIASEEAQMLEEAKRWGESA